MWNGIHQMTKAHFAATILMAGTAITSSSASFAAEASVLQLSRRQAFRDLTRILSPKGGMKAEGRAASGARCSVEVSEARSQLHLSVTFDGEERLVSDFSFGLFPGKPLDWATLTSDSSPAGSYSIYDIENSGRKMILKASRGLPEELTILDSNGQGDSCQIQASTLVETGSVGARYGLR